MPYVVQFPGRGYLVRISNSGKRKFTDKVDKATIWSKKGHAKLAVKAAKNGGMKLKKGERVWILKVEIEVCEYGVGVHEFYKI